MELEHIKKEIETIRIKLNYMASQEQCLCQNQDLIKLSQKLDILINNYIYLSSIN